MIEQLLQQPAPELTYEEYIAQQLDRSIQMREYDPDERTAYLLRILTAHLPFTPPPRILCVGCRNRHELDHIRAAGYPSPVGIDLHSADPRIHVMDMHRMTWADGAFDALFASHSLEHALDPVRACSEFCRVTRDGGLILIEVPIRCARRKGDLWDLRDPATIASLFPSAAMIWSETGPQIGAAQEVARVLLRTVSP